MCLIRYRLKDRLMDNLPLKGLLREAEKDEFRDFREQSRGWAGGIQGIWRWWVVGVPEGKEPSRGLVMKGSPEPRWEPTGEAI